MKQRIWELSQLAELITQYHSDLNLNSLKPLWMPLSISAFYN